MTRSVLDLFLSHCEHVHILADARNVRSVLHPDHVQLRHYSSELVLLWQPRYFDIDVVPKSFSDRAVGPKRYVVLETLAERVGKQLRRSRRIDPQIEKKPPSLSNSELPVGRDRVHRLDLCHLPGTTCNYFKQPAILSVCHKHDVVLQIESEGMREDTLTQVHLYMEPPVRLEHRQTRVAVPVTDYDVAIASNDYVSRFAEVRVPLAWLFVCAQGHQKLVGVGRELVNLVCANICQPQVVQVVDVGSVGEVEETRPPAAQVRACEAV
mmetsp:Transcript_11283/g.16189  ORF Transcript_11283/g.16189 Transcript_11283/m.16189 type:complete len:267 (-) Transcript_11283:358-1158(-)